MTGMQIGRAQASRESDVLIGPFVLLRYTGLAPARLELLVARRTHRLLGLAGAYELWLDRNRSAMTDALGSLVSGNADTSSRRALINLRRAVHNSRPIDRALESEPLLDLLRVHRQIMRWIRRERRCRELRRNAEAAFVVESGTNSLALTGLVRNHNLYRGLLFANPGFHAESVLAAGGRIDDAKRRKRIEDTLYQYVTRAAVKHSPMSAFMYSCLCRWQRESSHRPYAAARRIVRDPHVSRLILAGIVKHLAARKKIGSRSLALNRRHAARDDGRTVLVRTRPQKEQALRARIPVEEIAQYSGAGGLYEALRAIFGQERTLTYVELERRLAGKIRKPMERLVDELTASGMLEVVPEVPADNWSQAKRPFDPVSGDPDVATMTTLALQLRRLEQARGTALREGFDAAQVTLSRLIDATNGAQDVVSGAPRFFDSAVTTDLAAGVPSHVPDMQPESLRVLVGKLMEDHHEVLMAKSFVLLMLRREGRKRMPLIEFVARFSEMTAALTRVAPTIRSREESISALRSISEAADPVLIEAASFSRWYTGNFQPLPPHANAGAFVVNNLFPGVSRSTLRHIATDPVAGDEVLAFTAAACTVPPGDLALELYGVFDFDANTRPVVLQDVLPYEHVQAQGRNVHGFDELILVEEEGRLAIRHAESDRRIGLYDFGALNHGIYPELMKFVYLLAQFDRKARGLYHPEMFHDVPQSFEREYAGDIVYRRRAWSFPRDHLPGRGDSHRSFASFASVDAWYRKNNLPHAFFVRSIDSRQGVPQRWKNRKPEYVDLRSPFGAAAFLRACERCSGHLLVEEALPAPTGEPGRRPLELSIEFHC